MEFYEEATNEGTDLIELASFHKLNNSVQTIADMFCIQASYTFESYYEERSITRQSNPFHPKYKLLSSSYHHLLTCFLHTFALVLHIV